MSKKKQEKEKAITLIALVITIIVLLILAGISIATLTGENGVLTKANTAKTNTDRASAKEKVQIAVKGSYGTNGSIEIATLRTNLKQTEGVTGAENVTSLPATVTVDGYSVTIEPNGKVTLEGEGNIELEEPKKVKVEDVKNNEIVFDTKTEIEDNYENKVVVPEGFKITKDSATDVTGGIVIEDVTNEATAGSQFVWIPVGKVKTANETKTIELSRYTFADNGIPTKQRENTIETYYQELASSSYGNTTAKDIEIFKTSATTNNGYYIGRYEARSETQRTSKNQALEQVTVKPNDYIYNYVTQPKAATLARGMYASSNFTSDLMNSYAWDTAIVFIQNFGQANYSKQGSLNTSLATQGTNNLTDTTKQDKQLNIWDMASNSFEWTTETHTNVDFPCVDRGGIYSRTSYYTSFRNHFSATNADSYDFSFRVALYL